MSVSPYRNTQIQILNPEPSVVASAANTPTQFMEVGPTGILNASNTTVSAASKAAQVAPAIVITTTDPMVKNAIWYNTVSGTFNTSTQGT